MNVFIAVWIMVLLSASTSGGSAPMGDCPIAKTTYVVFLRDSSTCSIFHFCNWGQAVEFICPTGLLFNPNLNACDWSDNVDCNLRPNPRTCDGCSRADCPKINNVNVTFFPHDTDCDKYCMCDWGKAYERPCPEGLHWNTNLNVCDWPVNAGCNLPGGEGDGECGSTTNDTPTSDTTTNVTPSEDASTPLDDTPTDDTTTNTTPSVDVSTKVPPVILDGCKEATCPQINDVNVTFYPHDNNCEQYCVCNWGTAIMMSCPEGLYFNTNQNVCDLPENSECIQNGGLETTEISEVTETTGLAETTEVTEVTETTRISETTEVTEATETTKTSETTDIAEATETTKVLATTEATEPTETIENTEETETTGRTDGTTEESPLSSGCSGTICLSSTPQIIFPHNTACDKYCICNFGVTIEMPCPTGFHFNRALNICDYPRNANCNDDNETTTPTEPPTASDDCSYVDCSIDNGTVFYPHETDCDKYCICNVGRTSVVPCPYGFHYNRGLEMCDYPKNAGCGEVTTEPPVNYDGCSYGACTVSNGTVFFAHEYDCSVYCLCILGGTIEVTCPDGLLFNSILNICDSSENSKCYDSVDKITTDLITASTTPSNIFDGCSYTICPVINAPAFFQHTKDCTKYCTCNYGIIVEMPCPDGFHFNENFNRCEYPKNLGCHMDSTDETTLAPTELPEVDGCAHAICSETDSPTFFSNEYDCDKYCVCNLGVTIKMACPLGFHFNMKSMTCEESNGVVCDEGSVNDTTNPPEDFEGCSNVVCPEPNSDFVTFFHHDLDCGKYCVCDWGRAIEMPCLFGLHFNAELNVCDFPIDAGCDTTEVTTDAQNTDETESTITTEAEVTETTEDAGITEEGTTTADLGTTEDPETTEDADNSEDGSNTSTASTTEKVLPTTEPEIPINGCDSTLCPALNDVYVTFLAHTNDCGKYCVCDSGRAIEMACPIGLHFNAELNVCDSPIDAGCDTTEVTTDAQNTDEAESTITTEVEDGEATEDTGITEDGATTADLGTTEDPETTEDADNSEDGSNTSTASTTEKVLPTTEPEIPINGCDSTLCPALNDVYVTFLAHTIDCGKYCVCDSGRAIEMPCPLGLHFNAELSVCNSPVDAGCDTTEVTTDAQNTDEAESTITTEVEDGEATEDTGITEDGATTADLRTTEGPETTEDADNSEDGSNTSTASTTEKVLPTTEPEIPINGCDSTLCPALNDVYVTFLAHKIDCGKYCVCDWGRAIEMYCPPGLYFNTIFNVCDYPYNVNCSL